MNKVFSTFLLLCTTLIMITACRKKSYEDYYARPDSLEPPIYQTLQAKGRFTTLLSVIDKSGYKGTLSSAGYWTFFAPNDSAFQVYFRENSINGIGQLDSSACQKIVTYSLVYYAFNKDRIDDYQSNVGWQVNSSFRRRTANYNYVYSTKDTNNNAILAIGSNRNNNGSTYYIDADRNTKYIPVLTDTFFRTTGLTAADYTYFYPNTPFSGFNVAGAQVLEKNIAAENGVIHEVNRVITELPSIDQYLASKPDYSLFKSIFDKYLVQYILNTTVTQSWNNRGNSGQVFTKVFDNALAFSPNNENFLKAQDNDGQVGSYTLFAPTNAVLQNFINSVLLEYYPAGSTLSTLPRQVIYDLINAHMWQSAVWPSRFNSTYSFLNEEARFNATTDIVDKQMLSNGTFYGTNKVQAANVFNTVYARAYLDPNYSQMMQLMGAEIRNVISNPNQQFTVFMMSNAAIAAAGYVQNPFYSTDPNGQWIFTPPAGSTATAVGGVLAYNRLLRMLNMHVVPGIINNLGGTGIVQTYGNEYITWNTNRIQAVGNLESTVPANNWVNVTGPRTYNNGKVYYCDKLLNFSETTIGKQIEKLATTTPAIYSSFFNYLKSSTVYNATTGEVAGISSGSYYTVFIPNNAAITAAVTAGFLPASPTSTVPADQIKVANFILYHITKRIEGVDNIDRGGAETVLINPLTGNPTTMFVKNGPSVIQIGDMITQTTQPGAFNRASTLPQYSNVLANRSMIHAIDNFLRYSF